MTFHNIGLGKTGELLAAEALERHGYRILERNFRTKLGEIDIIACDHGTICFIEVKTRKTLKHGSPLESVSRSKQHKLSQLALCFLKKKRWFDKKARFDVVSIVRDDRSGGSLDIIRNAFDLDNRYSY